MSDPFSTRTRSPADPAETLFDILPDDTADLPRPTLALNVASPGTVRVTTVDGSTETLTLQPGLAFPVRARRVWQSGTSATGIKGLA